MKWTTRPRQVFLLLVVCLLLFASCVPAFSYREWTYADLRLLDPVDDALNPSTDILAVYTRTIGSDLEIRVDLLDLPLTPDYHLRILLDTSPAALPRDDSWDLAVDIPAAGRPRLTPSNSAIVPRLVRDPLLDTVTLRFNRRSIPQPFTLQVASFTPGESTPADETLPVRSDAFPPQQRAPLLLVFWDVFPAATPAQALRRWDGAHSGPLGERHGLKHVLDNAELFRIPVAVLDLKTPPRLAALNFIGALPQLKRLSASGLLLLPDVAFAEPSDVSLDFSRRAASGFGLPASQFVYNASSRFQSNYPAQFLPLDQVSHLSRSGATRLLPLPAADAIQAALDGPSLDVRRTLMNTALSADPSDLVVVGGDLPLSTWGNEDMAAATFSWISAHPWIQPLTGSDLMTFPLDAHSLQLPSTPSLSTPFLRDLRAAPDNSLTGSAWQSYFMLTAPTNDEKLLTMRANYLGQIGELLAAARWAEHPSVQAGCADDLNSDGVPECVLSNRNLFAVFEVAGARLVNLFSLDESAPHQLVGPSSQFTVGLSDPSEWHPELGVLADPSVIPGAFSDDSATWLIYQPVVTSNGIVFTSPDGTRRKTFRLLERGIEIEYQVPGTVSTRLPLAVDPQAFFFAPTEYTADNASGLLTWGLVNGVRVELHSDAAMSVQSFTESLPYISQPENPDRGYPNGHYLPFPLEVVNIQGRGSFTVQIYVK